MKKKYLVGAITSLLVIVLASVVYLKFSATSDQKNGRCFPPDFLFGSATAAYQVEGGWNESNREKSIWDQFCRANSNVQCANVADDVFHRYKSDFATMSVMGLESYRFSISWSRAMNWNSNSRKMVANPAGIQFYHDMIYELLALNITPIITMYHWDLPYSLEKNLSPSGWLNPKIQQHFEDYASLLLKEFGHQIKFWATFNEPHSFVTGGYSTGTHAPGLKNSSTNAYTVAHNVLLSHSKVVKLFRRYQAQGIVRNDAKISIVLNCDYGYPLDPSSQGDQDAAALRLQFFLGWFLHPIVYGDYPPRMKTIVGDRQPKFTDEESEHIRGSYDLLMLNHYSSKLITPCSSPKSTIECDSLAIGWHRDLAIDDNTVPHGARLASMTNGKHNCAWFTGYPQGYLDTIRFMHSYDRSSEILLTENGWCGNATVENLDQLWYFQEYLGQVHKAISEGIPIIGYTAWSFLDNYEWGSFDPRFGLFYVEFNNKTGSKGEYTPHDDELQRTPRPAANWFSSVAKSKCLDSPDRIYANTALEMVKSSRTSVSFFIILACPVVVLVFALNIRKVLSGTYGSKEENGPLVCSEPGSYPYNT